MLIAEVGITAKKWPLKKEQRNWILFLLLETLNTMTTPVVGL